MDRHITATPSFHLVDPISGEQLPTVTTWADAVRTLFMSPGIVQAIDLFDLLDLRKALLSIAEGETARVPDATLTLLRPFLTKPTAFSPAFLFAPGAEAFFRAFLDAPTKDPAKPAEP